MQTIRIPQSIATDRGIRLLLSQWLAHHKAVRFREKRIYWHRKVTRKQKSAAVTEKEHRKERWEYVAKILDIEKNILRMVAKETKHPDIWTSTKPDAPFSRRMELIKAYNDNRRASRSANRPMIVKGKLISTKQQREQLLTARKEIVSAIRMLEREWMIACVRAAFPELPDSRIPKPITLHASELYPRKLGRANKKLDQELASPKSH